MRRFIIIAAFFTGCAISGGIAAGDIDVNGRSEGVQIRDFISPDFDRRCTMAFEVQGNNNAGPALAIDCEEG